MAGYRDQKLVGNRVTVSIYFVNREKLVVKNNCCTVSGPLTAGNLLVENWLVLKRLYRGYEMPRWFLSNSV